MTTDQPQPQPQPKPVKSLWPSSLPFVGVVEEQEKKRLKTMLAKAIAIVDSCDRPMPTDLSSELPELLYQMWEIVEPW